MRRSARDHSLRGERAASWRGYLRSFHADRPGITELVLATCDGDPYGWLGDAVPAGARRVLDLACGSGPLYDGLSPCGYVGVDLSAAELSAAREREVPGLARADAARLPIATGRVDLVMCSMALQVLTPIGPVLDEIVRVLAPGGRLVAMLPSSVPLTSRDRWRWAQLLLALRRSRLDYPNDVSAAQLGPAGLDVVSDESRRFAYPVRDAAAASALVRSLYLPAVPEPAVRRAVAVAERWVGGEIGLPLRRVVAVRR